MKSVLIAMLFAGCMLAQPVTLGKTTTTGSLTVTVTAADAPLVPVPSRMPLDFYKVVVITTNTDAAEIRVSLTSTIGGVPPLVNVHTVNYNRAQNNAVFLFPVPKTSTLSDLRVTEIPKAVAVQ